MQCHFFTKLQGNWIKNQTTEYKRGVMPPKLAHSNFNAPLSSVFNLNSWTSMPKTFAPLNACFCTYFFKYLSGLLELRAPMQELRASPLCLHMQYVANLIHLQILYLKFLLSCIIKNVPHLLMGQLQPLLKAVPVLTVHVMLYQLQQEYYR